MVANGVKLERKGLNVPATNSVEGEVVGEPLVKGETEKTVEKVAIEEGEGTSKVYVERNETLPTWLEGERVPHRGMDGEGVAVDTSPSDDVCVLDKEECGMRERVESAKVGDEVREEKGVMSHGVVEEVSEKSIGEAVTFIGLCEDILDIKGDTVPIAPNELLG